MRLKAFGLAALFFALLAPLPAGAQSEKGASEIKVQKDRLSVRLEDAEFGGVMDEIGEKLGFEVRISSDISKKKVSTTFADVDVQRAINRLLALISQKTFFIHYTPDGTIKKIEVFSAAPQRRTPPETPAAPWRAPSGPTPPRPFVRPTMPPPRDYNLGGETEEIPPFEQPGAYDETAPDLEQMEEYLPEEEGEAPETQRAPYIPPRRAPSYVPPARRNAR